MPIIFACKGPWAGMMIEQSEITGYYCAAAGAVITLFLLRDCIRGYHVVPTLTIACVLFVLHPAWTIRAEGGDCGIFKLQASLLVTITYVGLLIYQYVAPRRRA
jgi:hypothetical protein